MQTIKFDDVAALTAKISKEFGPWSEPIHVTQEKINQFADVTGDHQWIHIDIERCKKESPFGGPVAHGFLTLSLVSVLVRSAMSFGALRLAINYGLNRVRFIAPVPAGSRIRARFSPSSVGETGGGVQVTWNITIEREGADKPCCVAEWLVRYYPS